MVTRLARWMGVLVAFGAMLAPAQAQDDPGELVRRCVNAMHETVRHGVAAIGDATQATVQRIERLDNGDASDRKIIAAGERGIQRVNTLARRASHRINSIAESCIEALRRMTDDRTYFMAIRRAQHESLDAIGNARDRGVAAIRHAVREAIDD